MSFSYVVHDEHRLVVSIGSDRVTWKEIKACQDQTKTDPRFNPEFNQIVDLRTVTGFDMSDQASSLARRIVFASTSKRAFVAPSPATFGMARMWEILSGLVNNPSEIRVFHDLPSALTWINLGSLPR